MFEKKSSYSKEELIACGEGRLFDAGIPRLPLPPMLMFDRFTEVSESGGAYDKGTIKAELDIKKDLWFFDCHFQDDPVMPGCLGLDAVWQMLGFYLGWMGNVGKGRALGCGEVKLTDQILPEAEVVEYSVDVKRVISRKLIMGVGDGTVSCQGKVIYQCKNLKVALFNEESTEGKS
jgi:3-hydroxyacyl-[acyl-carrier protein] dehydratase/trans-2-decenoyl-[acyl-carrier protein] isomerase